MASGSACAAFTRMLSWHTRAFFGRGVGRHATCGESDLFLQKQVGGARTMMSINTGYLVGFRPFSCTNFQTANAKAFSTSSSAGDSSISAYFHDIAKYDCIEASVHSALSDSTTTSPDTQEGSAPLIGCVTLNRPHALNALNAQTMREVVDAVSRLDADERVGAVVITGSGDKAFAAGADIKEMASVTCAEATRMQMLAQWEALQSVRIPMIAAVNGFALGGGCELAMMCDIIIASERAQFGQPEVLLGTTPGMGGSQRLTKIVGKSKAMDMVLTGRRMKADEAERAGLVARIIPHTELMPRAMEMAGTIAKLSQPAVAMCKECVNVALETSLQEGLRYERRTFWSTFALQDQKEGMSAFAEKRTPLFKHC